MNVYQTKNIRACVVVGVLVSAAIFLMLIWPGTDKTQDNSIRKASRKTQLYMYSRVLLHCLQIIEICLFFHYVHVFINNAYIYYH